MRVITMIVIVSILLVISIIDFKIKIIPNQLNVLLFISGIWSGFVFQEVTFLSRFLGVFSVSIPTVSYTHLDVYKRQLLESIQLFDVYEGSQIEEGYKSVAFSLVFRSPERSLEAAEINKIVDKILKELEKMGVELRA